MARPKESDVSSRLEMRFDERLKYLSEIAARAKGMTYREYLEWAVERSFCDVELRKLPQRSRPSMEMVNGELVTIDYSEQDAKDREDQKNFTLEHWKEGIWQPNPLARIIALKLAIHAFQSTDPEQNYDHLLTPEQERVWAFLWKHDEYLLDGAQGKRLNERLIVDNWQRIRDAALAWKEEK
jgi:hypothetical protein